MDLEQFLKYPFADSDWVKKIIIGCVISIVPILNILTLGYFMECIRMGISGKQMLPEWNNWGEHFMQGLMALIIMVAYMLIPLIVLVIPGVGVFLLVVVFVIAGIMIPMALANYAINQDFKAAFNFKEIIYQIGKVINYYIVAYFALVLVSGLGSSICLGAPLVAFIGSLLIFYSGIVYFNMVGQMYHLAVYG